MFALAATAAFLIIAAFLIGAYSMFRMSEHYNKIFRRIIEERTERKVYGDIFDFEVEPNEPKPSPRKPQRRPQQKRPAPAQEVKSDDDT